MFSARAVNRRVMSCHVTVEYRLMDDSFSELLYPENGCDPSLEPPDSYRKLVSLEYICYNTARVVRSLNFKIGLSRATENLQYSATRH